MLNENYTSNMNSTISDNFYGSIDYIYNINYYV